MKSRSIAVLLGLLSLTVLSSCDKDNDDDNKDVYTLSATLNGASEVPANSTTGSGTLTGTYDPGTNVLNYNVTWTGLTGTATAGHFHGPATTTQTAMPVISFVIVGNGASGVTPLTEQQEQELLDGLWYVNIHTAANTGGEIRGQVAATK